MCHFRLDIQAPDDQYKKENSKLPNFLDMQSPFYYNNKNPKKNPTQN